MKVISKYSDLQEIATNEFGYHSSLNTWWNFSRRIITPVAASAVQCWTLWIRFGNDEILDNEGSWGTSVWSWSSMVWSRWDLMSYLWKIVKLIKKNSLQRRLKRLVVLLLLLFLFCFLHSYDPWMTG